MALIDVLGMVAMAEWSAGVHDALRLAREAEVAMHGVCWADAALYRSLYRRVCVVENAARAELESRRLARNASVQELELVLANMA